MSKHHHRGCCGAERMEHHHRGHCGEERMEHRREHCGAPTYIAYPIGQMPSSCMAPPMGGSGSDPCFMTPQGPVCGIQEPGGCLSTPSGRVCPFERFGRY